MSSVGESLNKINDLLESGDKTYLMTAEGQKTVNAPIHSVESLQCSECNEVSVTLIEGVCNTCISKKDDKDEINWPKHYNAGKIQPIDAIESWQLDFRLANAVKYIARHKHKGTPKKDLEKALWYIQRYIDKELNNE